MQAVKYTEQQGRLHKSATIASPEKIKGINSSNMQVREWGQAGDQCIIEDAKPWTQAEIGTVQLQHGTKF